MASTAAASEREPVRQSRLYRNQQGNRQPHGTKMDRRVSSIAMQVHRRMVRSITTFGVAIGLIGSEGVAARALRLYPDRFAGSVEVDPNDISGAVRELG